MGNTLDDIEISQGGGNSFQDIIMSQLRQVIQLSNTEHRGGFYSIVTDKKGNEKEVYVMDSREKFSNGTYALALLLKPNFKKKKGMLEWFVKFKEALKKIQEDFIKKSSVDEEVILGESFYESTEDKILLETYRAKKLSLYLSLMAKLCEFLKNINYGEVGGQTEEDEDTVEDEEDKKE